MGCLLLINIRGIPIRVILGGLAGLLLMRPRELVLKVLTKMEEMLVMLRLGIKLRVRAESQWGKSKSTIV
jgi:hypothetical protein